MRLYRRVKQIRYDSEYKGSAADAENNIFCEEDAHE